MCVRWRNQRWRRQHTHTDCSPPPPPPPPPRSLVLCFSFHHNGLLSLLMAFFSQKRLSRFHTISPMIHQRSLVIGGKYSYSNTSSVERLSMCESEVNWLTFVKKNPIKVTLYPWYVILSFIEALSVLDGFFFTVKEFRLSFMWPCGPSCWTNVITSLW